MYERTVTANRGLSKQNALPDLVRKPGQVQPRLVFNYHYVYEDIPSSHIEAATNVHNLLSILSNKFLFSANIKYEYWVFNVYPDDHHYLAFHVLRVGQVQPTHVPQGTRSSSCTYSKLMNIVLRLITAS